MACAIIGDITRSAFFAADPRYRSNDFGNTVHQFKSMVRNFHAAGIEVILDVVYNHTAEGNQLGPTLSFRGIDNAAYYRLSPESPRHYMDFTGCGNTFHMQNPRVLQLIMDSLRYWVTEMHVDGFRFDLASTLARVLHSVDKLGAFFDIIHQDPILSQVKLIAEPWDLGDGGYQVGNFPMGWSEWNGKYRDCVRRFWKGDGGVIDEFATRLCGSSDLYGWNNRRPHASVNFITCHDGFSLRDLVSYDHKHNEANGEENRDGSDNNMSWNCGAEGPTDDPKINALRARKERNFLATLLLSQGIPMILAGDEFSHTQHGNNNAYCQDNEISWLNWELNEDQQALLKFVQTFIAFWHEQPTLQRRRFFHDRATRGTSVKDIQWFNPSGAEMTDAEWKVGFARSLGWLLRGEKIDVDDQGEAVSGDTLLILFNADHGVEVGFVLPPCEGGECWRLRFDTFDPSTTPVRPRLRLGVQAASLFDRHLRRRQERGTESPGLTILGQPSLIRPSVQVEISEQFLNSSPIFLVFLRRKKRETTTEKSRESNHPLDPCRIMDHRSVVRRPLRKAAREIPQPHVAPFRS